jgi:hypothetical protein
LNDFTRFRSQWINPKQATLAVKTNGLTKRLRNAAPANKGDNLGKG